MSSENIIFKLCKTCNLEKEEKEFRKNRRVCKKCVSIANSAKYGELIKNYYVTHQEEIIQRSKEYYQKKVQENGGPKKQGRPRTINVKT